MVSALLVLAAWVAWVGAGQRRRGGRGRARGRVTRRRDDSGGRQAGSAAAVLERSAPRPCFFTYQGSRWALWAVPQQWDVFARAPSQVTGALGVDNNECCWHGWSVSRCRFG
ncbi:hypothetical protein PLESTB_001818400 [Pleodorina starrii]|uniref:Secreted protein n=1 Tax=Pleodorina starrii TaxID=330485 RepID=A0A9W6C2I2_9CHLO|nr:hypothetical protein PLESTM_000970500 [Pleodorina starrii]GLC61911.1 hypothetical protein PLESTB_001818400 [Pleodorina starrii]